MVARFAEAKARAVAQSVARIIAPSLWRPIRPSNSTAQFSANLVTQWTPVKCFSYLSGRTHCVPYRYFVLRLTGRRHAGRKWKEQSVTLAPLDPSEIEAYITSGEPFDKAGGYAIQGRAGRYIPAIEGCYFNVVGCRSRGFHPLLGELGWRDDRQA